MRYGQFLYAVFVFSNLKTYKVEVYNLLIRQREFSFNHLYTSDSYMHTLGNNEDPDEMQHNAAFHQGLHCLLSQIQYLVKEK